jgi:hypothetical protein
MGKPKKAAAMRTKIIGPAAAASEVQRLLHRREPASRPSAARQPANEAGEGPETAPRSRPQPPRFFLLSPVMAHAHHEEAPPDQDGGAWT